MSFHKSFEYGTGLNPRYLQISLLSFIHLSDQHNTMVPELEVSMPLIPNVVLRNDPQTVPYSKSTSRRSVLMSYLNLRHGIYFKFSNTFPHQYFVCITCLSSNQDLSRELYCQLSVSKPTPN